MRENGEQLRSLRGKDIPQFGIEVSMVRYVLAVADRHQVVVAYVGEAPYRAVLSRCQGTALYLLVCETFREGT